MMDACGWPEIAYDGKLLVSQQDALLMGGKVQAAAGFADHVIVRDPQLCGSVRGENLHRHVLGAGNYAGCGRGAGLRPRKMYPLRRVPVELHAIARWRRTRISTSGRVRVDCTRRRTNESDSGGVWLFNQ